MKKTPYGFITRIINFRSDSFKIIRKKKRPGLTLTDIVNQAIDNHFTFNLTLYIIVHEISNRFHIGFYEDHEPHDFNWHYIYSTGSGTVGDDIRNEGFGRMKLEIVGKFSNLKTLIKVSNWYRRHLSKSGEPYLNHRADDSLELLIKTYSKSIGKCHAKKDKKKIRE